MKRILILITILVSILNSQIEKIKLYCDPNEKNTDDKKCNIRRSENIRITKNLNEIYFDINGYNLGESEESVLTKVDENLLTDKYESKSFYYDIPKVVYQLNANNKSISKLIFHFTDYNKLSKKLLRYKMINHFSEVNFVEKNILFGIDLVYEVEDFGTDYCLELFHKKVNEYDKIFYKENSDKSKYIDFMKKYSTSFIGLDLDDSILNYYQPWSWTEHILIDNKIVDIKIIIYIESGAGPYSPGDLIIRYTNKGYLAFLDELR